MKNKYIFTSIIVGLNFLLTACSTNGNQLDIDNKDIVDKNERPVINVESIDSYENIEITDWLDDETVLLSMENDSLNKMKLAELSEKYPRSLYFYNINTKEYKLISEAENLFLGGATLSENKESILYYKVEIGDPAYFVMNINNHIGFGIQGENIGGATSAIWSDNDVIGTTYNNSVFLASTDGDIEILDDLEKDIFLIRKVKDVIYYNTLTDQSLISMNLNSKEKIGTSLTNVTDVIPSPKGNELIINQNDGSKSRLLLSDLLGKDTTIIDEGSELGGISWSKDGDLISYYKLDTLSGNESSGIYVFDTISKKTFQILPDVKYSTTSWSPSGNKLAVAELIEGNYYSRILYLKNE